MQAIRDDVQPEHECVGASHHDRVREQRAQLLLRCRAERRGVERNRVVIEDGECSVEMIEARVDQLQGHDRHAQRSRDFVVCAQVGAKAVARQQHFTDL